MSSVEQGSALPLTCSIHGPGLDVDVRVADAAHLTQLARTFLSGIGEGIAFMNQHAPPHVPPRGSRPQPDCDPDHDPAILREVVTEDLRQMWNAMWTEAPARVGAYVNEHPSDHASRDAEFDAWVASPSGQAIIDKALSGGFDGPGDPGMRQN